MLSVKQDASNPAIMDKPKNSISTSPDTTQLNQHIQFYKVVLNINIHLYPSHPHGFFAQNWHTYLVSLVGGYQIFIKTYDLLP
jgi:hypothetical protein